MTLRDTTELQLLAVSTKLAETITRLKSVEAELKTLKQNRRQSQGHATRTFHGFSKLPTELRHAIWNLTCIPRLVPFNEDHDGPGLHTRTPNPPIFYVCKEARDVALHCYENVNGAYFSFERDTFVVCETWRDRELILNEFFDDTASINSDNEEFLSVNAPEPSILHNLRRLCNLEIRQLEWPDLLWIEPPTASTKLQHESSRLSFMRRVQSIAIPFIAWQGLSSFEAKEHLEASEEIMNELTQLPALKEIVLLVHNQPGWDSTIAYEAVRPREGPRTAIGSSAIFRLNTNDWQTMDDYALIGYEHTKIKITHMCGSRLYTS